MSVDSSTLRASELQEHRPIISASGEWRRFAAFLRRPALPEQIGRFSFAAVRRMLALDLMLMMALFTLAAIALLLGVTFPENSNSNLEPTLATFALAILLAPLLEELFFRGPLSGKPAHLLTLVTVIVAGIVAGGILAISQDASVVSLAAILLALVAIVMIKITMSKREPAKWFVGAFPLFFWISCAAFALIHFVNYQDGMALIVVPLVAPQFILGTICGYLRVHHGLLSSILLHALHNSLALGIAFSLTPLSG